MTCWVRIFNFQDVIHPTHVNDMDNACPHTSHKTRTFMEKKGFMLLAHPPYSPDMASCDFFLFPELKKMLAGNAYDDEEDLL